MSERARTAAVIGGGLGGLGVALRLACAGWRVMVFEAGPTFGGKMNRWESQGYRFDTGPSLITMPWVFHELFAHAGAALADHLALRPVQPLAHYRYPDGTAFSHSADLADWLDTVRRLEPGGADGFLRFMELGARVYELSRHTFLRSAPFERPDWRVMRSLRHLPVRHAWGNYHRSVASHFTSPHLRQLFDRYPTYVGSSPYACPATLAIIPYIEYAFGGWYVEGGLYRLVEALTALLEAAGVELQANARVVGIDRRGRRVTGVRLENAAPKAADVVIMNGDAACAGALLGEPGWTLPPVAGRSLSGLVFLAGVNRKLPGLHHHSVYFSEDYRAEFQQLFGEQRFPDDPTVYVNAPSRTDPSVAPEGGESLFIMANAPAADEPWDGAQVAQARERVLARLRASGFPELSAHTVVEHVITPRWMAERYLMPGGAIYGAPSHGWRNAFLRPFNRDRRYEGLYYVGGSTHPGGGTPIVLLSAKIVSELIERHER